MIFKAKFRIIVNQEVEAPDRESAKKVATAVAHQIFQEHDGFDYVEFTGELE